MNELASETYARLEPYKARSPLERVAYLLAVALPALCVGTTLAIADVRASAVTWPECLNRDVLADVREAGAEPWELLAIAVVTAGDIGKGPVDYIRVSDTEVALGWAHFTAGSGRLGITGPNPEMSDLNHYWLALEVLYSDAAGPVSLEAWRRIVRPAVRAATHYDLPAAWAAALANSGPGRLVDLIESCKGDRECIERRYVSPGGLKSEHRENRVRLLREMEDELYD